MANGYCMATAIVVEDDGVAMTTMCMCNVYVAVGVWHVIICNNSKNNMASNS